LTIPSKKALWDVATEVRVRLLTGLMPEGFSVGSTTRWTRKAARNMPLSTWFRDGATKNLYCAMASSG